MINRTRHKQQCKANFKSAELILVIVPEIPLDITAREEIRTALQSVGCNRNVPIFNHLSKVCRYLQVSIWVTYTS